MIHLECDNDETLMLALGKTRGEVSHHAGKGRVSKGLSESTCSEDLGLIDQDPGQPPPKYLREFQVVEEAVKLGLILYKHPEQGKRLIEIQPDLEPWLYAIGTGIGVKPTDYQLPEAHSGLHQNAKLPEAHSGLHQNAKKHRRNLRNYLRACFEAKSPHLLKLASWV
jgi:hypothetical protein